MEKQKPKYISKDQALSKLQKYCAYQDRCHKEVRSKLYDLGMKGLDLENIIIELIQDNFLNELRFAQSYARGKFRIKRWGRVRITRELKQRQISAYCIKKAMLEIRDDDYNTTLYNWIEKKNRESRETNIYKRRNKIAIFIINKGFETSLVWEAVKEAIE